MNESKKSIIIVIIAVLVLAGLIYLVQRQRAEKPKPKESPKIEIPGKPSVAPEEVGAGKTGETEKTFKGEEIITLPSEGETGIVQIVLPAAIFNGFGKIKKIQANSLSIEGTGSNFADQKPRDLTLKFTAATKVNAQDKTGSWVGLEGLKHLTVGESISFESPENIRGKTEFEVSYINKL